MEESQATLIVFPDPDEAETARAMLERAGIGSWVESHASGHAVLVEGRDLAKARDFLSREEPEEDTDEGETSRAARESDALLKPRREANARRAFFAAWAALVVGALLRPVPERLLLVAPLFLAIYSLWLVVDVVLSPERLSLRGRWLAGVAGGVDLVTVGLLAVLVRAVL